MLLEYESFLKNNVWTLLDKPPDQKVIQSKWVFKIKRDSDDNVEKFKARLVAKGFSQTHGVDYFETYSPVIRHSTLRYLSLSFRRRT